MPSSTVSGILTWIGLGKLSRLEPAELANRYEKRHPGELVRAEVKKLGKIARPGHRVTGRLAGGGLHRRAYELRWEYVRALGAVRSHNTQSLAVALCRKRDTPGGQLRTVWPG